jgi:PadR family transcriptional regulator, regulatory protein AphA
LKEDEMDLRNTILGLLSWKRSSGYDLKRIISDSEVFYWSGNNNQIYKSLIELQKEELVTYQVQVQESLPAKKIYSITDKGLSELYHSLLAAPEAPELRKDFLIQLAWAEILSDEEILTLLGKYEDEIASRLRMYQAQAARPGSAPDRSKREKYLWKRIAENLIAACQTELDWVRQTQQEFRDRKYID